MAWTKASPASSIKNSLPSVVYSREAAESEPGSGTLDPPPCAAPAAPALPPLLLVPPELVLPADELLALLSPPLPEVTLGPVDVLPPWAPLPPWAAGSWLEQDTSKLAPRRERQSKHDMTLRLHVSASSAKGANSGGYPVVIAVAKVHAGSARFSTYPGKGELSGSRANTR